MAAVPGIDVLDMAMGQLGKREEKKKTTNFENDMRNATSPLLFRWRIVYK